jgi:LPS-assembly lipoprotein
MSSHDRSPARRAVALSLSVGVSVLLAGCLRPLYGPTASGQSMQAELAAIEVPEIPERLGHYLRSELMFLLDGSGQPSPKRYRLTINPTTNVSTAVIDAASTRADAATLTGNAPFQLKAVDGDRMIFTGTAVGSATYDRSNQRYATVRAARDAEIRLAKLLAEQIKNRVAAALASRAP